MSETTTESEITEEAVAYMRRTIAELKEYGWGLGTARVGRIYRLRLWIVFMRANIRAGRRYAALARDAKRSVLAADIRAAYFTQAERVCKDVAHRIYPDPLDAHRIYLDPLDDGTIAIRRIMSEIEAEEWRYL